MPFSNIYKQLLASAVVFGAAMVSSAADTADMRRSVPLDPGKTLPVPPSHVTINHETHPLGIDREFQIDAHKTISRARAYVTGVGSYVMRLNGKKVGDEYMAPMKTYYDTDKSRILYRTFDIKGWLKPGANAVGIMLQSGFLYAGSYKAICELHINYTDGTKDVVLSDSTWKGFTGGPYVLADYISTARPTTPARS